MVYVRKLQIALDIYLRSSCTYDNCMSSKRRVCSEPFLKF